MGYELTVRVIGSLSVSRNGEVLAGTDVGSRKARLLLGAACGPAAPPDHSRPDRRCIVG